MHVLSAEVYLQRKASFFKLLGILLALILLNTFASAVWATSATPTHSRDGNYSVSWKNRLYENGTQIASVSNNGSRNFSGQPNGSYDYWSWSRTCTTVTYVGTRCTPWSRSSTVTVTVTHTPGTPGSVSVTTPTFGGSYSVSWGAASNANLYTLEKRNRASGGSWSAWSGVYEGTSRTHTYSASSQAPGTQLQYRVKAYYSLNGLRSHYSLRTASAITIPSAPSFRVSNASVSEGGTLSFTVTKSGSTALSHSINYATSNGSTASTDYSHRSGTLTFSANQTSELVQVPTTEDSRYESNESLYLNLSGATNYAVIADNRGTGTINNDDSAPSFRVNNVSVSEGGSLTFTITKSGATGLSHRVSFATAHSSAGAADYVGVSGTRTFAANESTKTVSVSTLEDTLLEANETLRLNLSSATAGATISDSQGIGTINNDDSVSFRIRDASVTEGNSVDVTVDMVGQSALTHTVGYRTTNASVTTGVAAAGQDYTASSGTLSFAAGVSSRSFSLQTIEDKAFEGFESLQALLSSPTNGASLSDSSATIEISDDDPAPYFIVNDPVVSEGGHLTFRVQCEGETAIAQSVDFSIAAGSATANADYTGTTSGTLSFSNGVNLRDVIIPTTEEAIYEANETLTITLSNPQGGTTIQDGQGTGTINNDDPPPSFSIGDATQDEGGTLSFVVTKSGATAFDHAVSYATETGTAGTRDFTASSSSVSFAPGQTSRTVTVSSIDDNAIEKTEAFTVNLSSASAGATIGDGSGVGRIIDNDTIDDHIATMEDYLSANGIDNGIDPTDDALSGDTYFGALRGTHHVSQGGALNYSVDILVPPGINGMQPKLSVAYNSDRRNGLLGWGWDLRGLATISRCPASLARDGEVSGINPGDAYKFCLNGQRLVEVADREYRTEAESFSIIESVGGTNQAPDSWRVRTKTGAEITYGAASDNVRVDGAGSAMAWFINRREDIAGNYMTYHYHNNASTGTYRIDRIEYTKNDAAQGTDHAVVFNYEEHQRPDTYRRYRAGSVSVHDRRIANIEVSTNGQVVTKYVMDYQAHDGITYADPAHTSRLASITQCFDAAETTCGEAVQFEWTPMDQDSLQASTDDPAFFVDHDIPDIELADTGTYAQIPSVMSQRRLAPTDSNKPNQLRPAQGDFDGDGLHEMIRSYATCNYAGSPVVVQNLPCHFYVRWGRDDPTAQPAFITRYGWVRVREDGTLGLASPELTVMDVNGDGIDDVIVGADNFHGGLEVYLSTETNEGRTFARSVGHSIPQNQFLYGGRIGDTIKDWNFHVTLRDMNGDGLVDILRMPTRSTTLNDSLGDMFLDVYVALNQGTGFATFARWGLTTDVLAPGDEGVPMVTDVTGDGLPDLVGYRGQVAINRNGNFFEVQSHWQTDANVAALPPMEISSITRLRHEYANVADVNGDGLADLLSLRSDGLYVALSTGSTFLPSARWSTQLTSSMIRQCSSGNCPGSGSRLAKLPQWGAMDVNHDGLVDVFHLDYQFLAADLDSTDVFIEHNFDLNILTSNGRDGFAEAYSALNSGGEFVQGSATLGAPTQDEYGNAVATLRDFNPSEYHGALTCDRPISCPDPLSVGNRYSLNVSPTRAKIVGITEAGRRLSVKHQRVRENTAIYAQQASDGGANDTALNPNIFVTAPYASGASLEEAITAAHVRDTSIARVLGGREVVADVSIYDHETLATRREYRYFDNKMDIAGFGNLGFGRVEDTLYKPVGDGEKIFKTKSHYHQEATGTHRLAGNLKQRVVLHGDPGDADTALQTLSDTRNQWEVRVYRDDIDTGSPSPRYFAYVAASSTEKWDLNGATASVSTMTRVPDTSPSCDPLAQSAIDTTTLVNAGSANDNRYHALSVPLYSDTVSCGGSSDNAVVRTVVENSDISSVNQVIPLIGRVDQTATTGDRAENLGVAQVRSKAYTYNTLGQLHTETREPDGDATVNLTTTYSYNAYGSVSSMVESWQSATNDGLDFTERATTIDETYDTAGERTTTVTNPLNHSETTIYNAVFGLPREVTDANELVTSMSYDALGRLERIDFPDSGTTDYHYRTCAGCFNDHNSAAAYYVQEKATGVSATRAYFDARDRELGSRSRTLDGRFVYQVNTYDALGRLSTASNPDFTSGNVTRHVYDAMNRLDVTTHPDASTTRYGYDGLHHTTTNVLGQTQTRLVNGAGWVVRATDNANTPVDYTYWPFGELKSTQVDNNTATTVNIDYDVVGRKTLLNDPNTGAISYRYNALDLLAEETDAVEQVTRYTYDRLGRQVGRTDDATGLNGSSPSHSWRYDTATNGIGLLATLSGIDTQDRVFEERYTYTPLSLLEDTETRIDGADYTLRNHYDNFSRLVAQTYPSGFGVVYRFNSYGYMTRIHDRDDYPIWQGHAANAWGSVTSASLGNGVSLSRTDDEHFGRVSHLGASRGGLTVQDQDYGFDALGNLRYRIDQRAGVHISQHFCYDALNRLASIEAQADACGAPHYSYDNLGNITAKAGIGGALDYGQNGAGPNAVTTANGLTYQYDDNGNMVRALNGGAPVRTVNYSAFNKPTLMVDGANRSEIIYGAHQGRIQRIDNDGRTSTYAALGLYEEIDDNGIVDKIHLIGDIAHYITQDGPDDGVYTYQHRDHQGSVVAVSEEVVESSADIRWQSNDAWGQRRDQRWNGNLLGKDYVPEDSARGYTDHEHLDNVGLIHMNGRVYDPVLGRFLSPDPLVQAPHNTQSYNRYAYVFNNPLSFVDPSGYLSKGCIDGDSVACEDQFDEEVVVVYDRSSGREFGFNVSFDGAAAQQLVRDLQGSGDPNVMGEVAFNGGMDSHSMFWASLFGAMGDDAKAAADQAAEEIAAGLIPGGEIVQQMVNGGSVSTIDLVLELATFGKGKYAKKASELPIIKQGTKEWDAAVEAIRSLGRDKLNFRTKNATEAKKLLLEARGNMDRRKQYTNTKYNKGYEVHNSQNDRELRAKNDLQHLKWKDGKSGGHIFYDKPN